MIGFKAQATGLGRDRDDGTASSRYQGDHVSPADIMNQSRAARRDEPAEDSNDQSGGTAPRPEDVAREVRA